MQDFISVVTAIDNGAELLGLFCTNWPCIHEKVGIMLQRLTRRLSPSFSKPCCIARMTVLESARALSCAHSFQDFLRTFALSCPSVKRYIFSELVNSRPSALTRQWHRKILPSLSIELACDVSS